MAYVAIVTHRKLGNGLHELQIDETDAATASEASIDLAALKLPIVGDILIQEGQLISGGGATISPVLGRVTNPTNLTDIIVRNGTAAAGISNQGSFPIPYDAKEATWYHRARVNTGSNNVIKTVYRFQERR